VGKIAEKAACKSAFLTIWHCIFGAELTKNALLQTNTQIHAILSTGITLKKSVKFSKYTL